MSVQKYADDEVIVRQARREDMAAVVDMIQELADFEKMSDGPKLTVKDLERDGFDSTPPLFRCKVAVLASPPPHSPAVVGYSLYYSSYSTWEGRATHLEDLYVRPTVRGRGIGGRLFDAVAKEAYESGCSRVDFNVLSWNPARSFYSSRGAADLTATEQWQHYRLTGDALRNVARR